VKRRAAPLARDHRATIAMANVKRTFWSPKWSPTRDHGRRLNGTERHVRPIFAIQINTCQDRTKRVGTTANKFRVRCFQSSLAPANASLDPGKATGQRWPQLSMPSAFRKVYLDIERERSIEQLNLAIKMVPAEPAVRHLFAAALQQPKPQQRSQDPRLHRVGRLVPCPGKHRRLWNSAKPRQFLGRLPVIGANRQ
jgi:hypothetical protein